MRTFSLFLILTIGTVFTVATPKTGETLRVRVGTEGKAASALNIKFVELIDDSRCPKGTTCIWAGEGKIKLTISKPGRNSGTFELATTEGKNRISFGGYDVELVELTPQPAANVRLDRTKYTATLLVKRSGKS